MKVQLQEINGETFAKVRIAVCINRKGEWCAEALFYFDADQATEECVSTATSIGIGPTVSTHFVYALVPVPRRTVIAGSVDHE